jgi:predicted DNA-binding antitoxin AbrB/MazE fold protein
MHRITVEAVYENGVFRPVEPVELKEGETVRLFIQRGETPLIRAYGIMDWRGDPEVLRRLSEMSMWDQEEDQS